MCKPRRVVRDVSWLYSAYISWTHSEYCYNLRTGYCHFDPRITKGGGFRIMYTKLKET